MEPRSLKYIAESCGGLLRNGSPDTVARGIGIDSRTVQPGDVFVALPGERFDGHDFVPEVMEKGVAGVIVEKKTPPKASSAVIEVKSTRHSLGQIAARYRQDYQLNVVTVGGSNGKTTTKELIAAVLRQKLRTVWSEASFNNDIGVPLTLLRIQKSDEAAVLEAGSNHPGELAPLLLMIKPRFGVITNIGREHLEFFRDLDGVVAEEGVLAENLPPDGKLFMNDDSPEMGQICRRSRVPVVRIGTDEKNDWCWSLIKMDLDGARFRVKAPAEEFSGEYRIHLLGKHQVANATLAIAVGKELGLGRAEIQRGLTECQPAKMRLQLRRRKQITILNDVYNANPDSMSAGLKTLAELPSAGRRVAVLGDMGELGPATEEAHREVGRKVAELGIDLLLPVGQNASFVAEEAGRAVSERFSNVDALIPRLKNLVRPKDLILIKASRSSHLERVVQALESEWPE